MSACLAAVVRVMSAESIHGELAALGELLMHTGEFLLAR
jgi:hypothetical protein